MLVLSRRVGERVRIGDSIVVTVSRISGNQVRLGFEAPPAMTILREEVPNNIEVSTLSQVIRNVIDERGADATA